MSFKLVAAACMALCILPIKTSSARDVSRLEVEGAIQMAGRGAIFDADNRYFRVMRVKIPRHHEDSGFACGAIEILGSPIGNDGMQSFHAFLSLRHGKLNVLMAGLFMSAEELLQSDMCK